MAHVSKEVIEKLSFGKEYIKLQIPKMTEVLIVTSISKAIDGSTNISTVNYIEDEIEKINKEGEIK